MLIEEKNEGPKVVYNVKGTRITFENDLSLDLAKRQNDYPVSVDICRNSGGALTMGTMDAIEYVAQIYIPAAEYNEVIEENKTEAMNMECEKENTRIKKELNMELVKLVLWGGTRG